MSYIIYVTHNCLPAASCGKVDGRTAMEGARCFFSAIALSLLVAGLADHGCTPGGKASAYAARGTVCYSLFCLCVSFLSPPSSGTVLFRRTYRELQDLLLQFRPEGNLL